MPLAATILNSPAQPAPAAEPVISVLAVLRFGGRGRVLSALEFLVAMHGFVLLEMTGAMNGIDADAVFTDMVLRLASGNGNGG